MEPELAALDYLKEELAELEAHGLAIHPRTLEGPTGARARFDGRDVINLASNNYLGLANHPRMNAAASRAALELGAGTGAVRSIAGTMSMHRELERRFAEFKHAPDALMFQSGFTANAGTVAAILGKEDVIVSDRLNHASIIDGARLSRAEIKVFEHRDAEHADTLLAETARPGRRQLLITDGVFSMDGDIAPLPDLVEVAERRGAIMMIDDAHASGVLGRGGAGTVDHFDLHGRVDVQVGTLSKAIGVLGGFIAGPPELILWLVNRGRPYLFSTSAPPAVTVACLEALDILHDEPQRLERLWSNTRLFKEGLHALGFDTGHSETPITPVITGEEEVTQAFARRLFEEGVFTPAIVYPTVAKGRARVRTIVTADHTEDDLREALQSFQRVGHELRIL
ncbi:MAG TPA: glycine C-acetyltransferase [Actinomycetota bacterium]|nr:glycine C-acetyltransferase [Actinomycetota bacterium]